ncbi:Z1 domain-containing protein [Porphyromonas levii]|uniref:Z1 domain-containing protein n=1 Tax=Porphyromonas levii TaxID=28114 RepID=UPI001B8BA214|nr:Z1 domain-containing protein [Porphyromonas levii]MBR8769883.1 hypothetical protein [Porphyromonas levii]
MKIELIDNNPNRSTFVPAVGTQTIDLLERLKPKLGEEGIQTIRDEAIEILSHCTNPRLTEIQSVTTLAVGYVQSGKTMSFTVLSTLAHDNGFRVIIYFTGTKNNLLGQTNKRLRKDLINDGKNSQTFKLFSNPTIKDATQINNTLRISTHPTILITVLKHHTHISNLAEMFKSSLLKKSLGYSGVLIIDDEADQASLNGYAFKNSKSEDWEEDEYTKTYSMILKLKSSLPNHSYVQYTATPQGPLLISILDLLSPKHHTVLTPGKTYTGGKTFFRDEPGLIITIPEQEAYSYKRNDLKECPDSLVDALQLHFMSVAIVVTIDKREKFLSMMVHADKEQKASEKFFRWVKGLRDSWSEILYKGERDLGYQELKKGFSKNYNEAIRIYKKHKISYPSFDEIWYHHINDIILDTNIELLISKNRKPGENREIEWTGNQSHILVGADMLNRGFTVENLATTYMPRNSSGKSTADTIQQRCRFFGYKQNYLYSCRVFLPEDVIQEYYEYTEHEEEMRLWLKENKNLEDVERLLLLSDNLSPTRKTILSKETVTTKLKGWRKMNAFQAIEDNKKFIDSFLATHEHEWKLFQDFATADHNHSYVRLAIQDVIEFLTHFKFQNMPDTARKQATLRYMKYLNSKTDTPLTYAYIFNMAYQREARERAFNTETLRVNNLHSGRSKDGSYPGDIGIKFDDSICIQIHKVKLKCDSITWGGKEAYTLAIYYPEDFAINYIEAQ